MTTLEKLNSMKEKINQASTMFLMGHVYLDLDAIGSCIGLASLFQQLGKTSYIIINDTENELAVAQVLEKIKNVKIIKGSEVDQYRTPDSLLIIVDTNKRELVQDQQILDKMDNVIVLDHHDEGIDTIQKGLVIIDKESSSACELVTLIIHDYEVTLKEEINTLLLAGIVLDTNNFVVKTDARTFYVAYLLTRAGADTSKVQYLLKQDIDEYIERQKVITNVEVIDKIALTKGAEDLRYRREDLAKIADTLLQFKGIEASFVIGRLDHNTVGISARSMGNLKVGELMSQIGGGGDSHEAAAKIEDKSIREVETRLKQIIM